NGVEENLRRAKRRVIEFRCQEIVAVLCRGQRLHGQLPKRRTLGVKHRGFLDLRTLLQSVANLYDSKGGTAMKTIVGINGAAGRMGQRLVHLIAEDKELTLGAALESANHPRLGQDIGELTGLGKLDVPLASDAGRRPHLDVLIDFSMPEGTAMVLPL